jgi:hypothetical protein
VTSHFFLLPAIFYKMLSKNTTRYFKTLSMAEKVSLVARYEEGISTTAIVGRLGRHRTSIKCHLALTNWSPNNTLPESKKQPRQTDNNKNTCFEGSRCNISKKPHFSVIYHYTVGLPVVRPLCPPDKSSIQGHFLFPKTMVFRPFYGICFLFFS